MIYALRGICVIIWTLGAFALGSLLWSPETTTLTSTVLGVVMLLCGGGGFIYLGRWDKD
jgi:hypothetical protein